MTPRRDVEGLTALARCGLICLSWLGALVVIAIFGLAWLGAQRETELSRGWLLGAAGMLLALPVLLGGIGVAALAVLAGQPAPSDLTETD